MKIENWNFTLFKESFLLKKEINSVVTDFVHTDLKMKSYSPLEFINALIELQQLNDETLKRFQCIIIMDTFIRENSSDEILIQPHLRKEIIEKFEKFGKNENLDQNMFYFELFDDVYQSQLSEISYHVFPKFLRSKKCLNILQHYVDDSTVLKLIKSIKFPYKDEDFKRLEIKQMDIDFMKDMIKDGMRWELCK